ncbi:glutamine synthetase/guanido kinase [Dacryopinax primogenitus]|uniref:Glutamine synthetase n=1 Tax=Dacryopinax primogenitus (strain DJM 731) TaxID=1858805 RepID=M5G521_DACPD|nr:glutamine synthetase/guanido kinase [Dacryopinax primogenitus]EJU05361.1 glutamine synthetase/guanido kinase [Dacryopinax primogenitus]
MPTPVETPGAPRTLKELEQLLSNDIKVKVAGVDVDGILRGKYMSKQKLISAVEGDGFGFCSVIFGWDMHDSVYSKELLISNKATGYRDLLAKIDLTTYRRIPWEGDVPFFFVSFLDPDTREPVFADPRSVIKKAMDQASAKGWQCMAGAEYEYFNFKETPQSLVDKKYSELSPMTTGMHGYSLLRTTLNQDYFTKLFDESVKFGIDIEGHHTETGPGVFETALAYTSALRMADNAILFKLLAKSVGMQLGVLPTFMAKPWAGLPGCSGHIHVSLRDVDGKNIFSWQSKEPRRDAANPDVQFLSKEGECFLAGVLDGLPDVIPMLVPTINGYKRLIGGENFWAPNAVTYGYDSRAASIRVLAPPGVPATATRFEIRVPGADMNPYFAFSAIFLLGLRGIEKKMVLHCPPLSDPSVTRENVTKLPMSLEAGAERMMRRGSVAREILGDKFVDHFGGTRMHEVALWNEAVTNWEVERYFELV